MRMFRAPVGSLLKGSPMKRKTSKDKDGSDKLALDHLAYIRTLPCLITGKTPSDAAHVSMASKIWGKVERGMSRKADDRWTVPLSHDVHLNEQHVIGEIKFWKRYGLDPLVIASRLWEVSGDIDAGMKVIRDARSVMKDTSNG